MRKKVNIQKSSVLNPATENWMQHLIQRLIVEQLDVPPRLQAKLLYQNLMKEGRNSGSEKNK
jgi:hypothetical protein